LDEDVDLADHSLAYVDPNAPDRGEIHPRRLTLATAIPMDEKGNQGGKHTRIYSLILARMGWGRV
jgi:hypothetical protein